MQAVWANGFTLTGSFLFVTCRCFFLSLYLPPHLSSCSVQCSASHPPNRSTKTPPIHRIAIIQFIVSPTLFIKPSPSPPLSSTTPSLSKAELKRKRKEKPLNSSMYASSVRPCYLEQDHGLASLKDMEGGHCANGFVSRSMTMGYAVTTSYNRINNSPRNLSSSVSSPRSGRFYDARFEDHQPHFLEACFLCKKPLGDNRDIFMYRGDTPFCSEECRQEQIEIDEAKEKNNNISSSMKALRNKEQRKSASPNKAQDYSFRTGAVAAAS